ncbi:MAG: hypothetical protein JXR03_18890 [Cyclobacteriaceae bacterium]
MNKRASFLIAMLFAFAFCHAQEEHFDRGRWKELKEQVTYQQNVKGKKEREKSETKNGNSRNKLEDSELRTSESNSTPYTINLGPVMQLIVIVLFIALIVWLLYTIVGGELFKSQPKRIKSDSELDDYDFNEVPEKTDLERWLDKALSKKDYRMAVRIYFLMIIQDLEKKGLIRWKKEKTNWDYLADLDGHQLQPSFRDRTMDFDLIWYGEKPISEEAMTNKIENFRTFLGDLNSSAK